MWSSALSGWFDTEAEGSVEEEGSSKLDAHAGGCNYNIT